VESHPQALTDPDVNLSIHPALIVQPSVASPFANGQIDWVPSLQCALTNRPPSVHGTQASCISALPTLSESVRVDRIPDKEQIYNSCRSS
jgi:hypothetical protein